MESANHVRDSFGRCTLKGDLMGRFYDIFLDSHPDIKPKFANTDLAVQKELLRKSISLSIMFADGKVFGKMGIDKIKDTHRRTKLNIHPNLYIHWKASLIQAISEFDSEFDSKLKSEWEEVLNKSTEFISSGYDT